MRFQDQVAIVTGSASGIDLATAIRMASEGAKVVLADRAADLLDACKQVGAAEQNEPMSSVCNVAEESDAVRTVAAAAEHFGGLDIVVNNAGLMSFKPIEEQTADDWESILRVDLLGAFFFIKHAFRQMQHGGAIDTPMLWDTPNVRSGMEKIDVREVGKPEDVAAAIAFLASPEAAFIHGATLRVDGGRLRAPNKTFEHTANR